MPPPTPVRLLPHDPHWSIIAAKEGERLRAVFYGRNLEVHHIGSTAILGLAAKPIIDLLVVAPTLDDFDLVRPGWEGLGYSWHGEYGLAGRRYCKLNDPQTGERRFHVHGYAAGHPAIFRHLQFRDRLHSSPGLAAEYGQVKAKCAKLHPDDSHAYSDCKSEWIRRVEAEAVSAEGAAASRNRTPASSSDIRTPGAAAPE